MKFLWCTFLLCFLLIAQAEDLRRTYASWKVKFNKKSSDGLRSEIERFRIFKKSTGLIEELNASQDSWRADLTIFADMTDGEKQSWLGIPANRSDPDMRPDLGAAQPASGPVNLAAFPAQKHWEVTEVRQQGSCGSCWAFAAVAALEGHHLKQHGEYREFSEQSILDCTFEGSMDGCNGGWSTSAIRWVGSNKISGTHNHGYLPSRDDNKYEGEDRRCFDAIHAFPNAMKRAKVATYSASFADRNNDGLLKNLANVGPFPVYIWAPWQLQYYQFGLYHGTGCGGIKVTDMNHAVTATGYGVDYFLIKNSWGKMWGRGGYGYFTRKTESICNVARHQILVSWTSNQNWDVCRDTHHSERTECQQGGESVDETKCGAMGCCWDPSARLASKCFAKGKLTVWDEAGNRRVLFGSTPDFAPLAFNKMAVSAQVSFGRWRVYEWDGYSTRRATRVLGAEDGKINMNIESAAILS